MLILTTLVSFLILAKAAPFTPPSQFLYKRYIDVSADDDDDDDYDYVAILAPGQAASSDVQTVLKQLSLSSNSSKVYQVYDNSAFSGFSISADRLTRDQMRAMDSIGVMERHIKLTASFTTRSAATWGLERVSSANFSGTQDGQTSTYLYDDGKLGAGADIYIVDTGINANHQDFGGRARIANDTTGDGVGLGRNEGNGVIANGVDDEGHGTHVAGIAASNTYGVASRANIWGIKALGEGAGSSADVLEGLNIVVNMHDTRSKLPGFVGSIASMSLSTDYGTGASQTFNTALANVSAHGIHVVVAAGNDGQDACQVSPASMGGAKSAVLAVGSIGFNNTRSSFSNSGSCVDVYAPGENVLSTWYSSDTATQVLSGTSMAAPFVTGILAYQMAGNPQLAASPAAMKKWVTNNALRGFVGDGANKPVAGDSYLLVNNGVDIGAEATAARFQLALKAVASGEA